MSQPLKKNLPESNVEQIARDLVGQTLDLDGSGLVRLFNSLLARAEEHQRILAHSARTSEAMLTGQELMTQEGVNAQALDTLYETTCLKLFLAQACKKIAEDLEYDVLHRQSRYPRIKEVQYSAEGDVESYSLDNG